MKSFSTLFLLSILALFSAVAVAATSGATPALTTTTTTEGSSSVVQTPQQPSRKLEDYEPWANGTPVYWNFPNEGWWKGTITDYDPSTEMYTVTWEDDSEDYYDDWDQIDQMVTYAQNDPTNSGTVSDPVVGETSSNPQDTVQDYQLGTKVAIFEEGQWWMGTVIDFSAGFYSIRWDSDDEVERVQPGAVMDQMVTDAVTHDNTNPAAQMWENGTPVAEYEEEEWWYGSITGYDADAGYTVTWDSGEVETYSDLDRVNTMVADGAETTAPTDGDTEEGTDGGTEDSTGEHHEKGEAYPVGTLVYAQFDGEWWVGSVESVYRGNYAIRWTDGSYDSYEEGSEMDQMVADAANIPGTGGSDVGGIAMAVIVIIVLVIVSVGALFGIKMVQRKRQAEESAKTASLEEPRENGIVEYRDDPVDDPKII